MGTTSIDSHNGQSEKSHDMALARIGSLNKALIRTGTREFVGMTPLVREQEAEHCLKDTVPIALRTG